MGWDRAQSGPVIPGTPGSDKTLNGPIFGHFTLRTAGRAESQLHESDRTRHWLRALAFVVPAAYCALAVILAPSDRLGAPSALNRTVSPGFSTKRLLYDDYDVTAMVLRGLNMAAGRIPSRQMRPNA